MRRQERSRTAGKHAADAHNSNQAIQNDVHTSTQFTSPKYPGMRSVSLRTPSAVSRRASRASAAECAWRARNLSRARARPRAPSAQSSPPTRACCAPRGGATNVERATLRPRMGAAATPRQGPRPCCCHRRRKPSWYRG
eukprot:1984082-Pleurochrysis_carterae.AAC.1